MPRRSAPSAALLGAVVLVAAPASAARAASVTISQPCQLAGFGVTATLTGFAPDSTVTLTGGPIMRVARTNAAGSARIVFATPVLSDSAPGSKQFIVTASDDAAAPRRAFARFRVANLAFGTSGGMRSPKAKRTWTFSGLQPGRPVWGHFRYGGRTRANHRFGVARAPCGELTVLAPGIPVTGRINSGRWSVQIDQRRAFSQATRPRMTGSSRVTIAYTR